MNSDLQFPWRRHTVFDPMNAHSQGDAPALMYVMQFNTDEREHRERSIRKQQMKRIQNLPSAKQHSVVQIIDTLLAQWRR
jgi:hypothetical protein